MKQIMKSLVAIGLVAIGLLPTAARAAESKKLQSVDSVTVSDGSLLAVAKGKSFTPTNSVVMPAQIQVMTNKTFTVQGGPARKLNDGQTLRKDGMLLSPDGSVVPVVDHAAMLRGKPVLVRNGKTEPVNTTVVLANGAKILPDGTVYDSRGTKTRLLDGQRIKLSGGVIPTADTVSLKEGKVSVYKDGGRIDLPPGRTIMMNNGTKVSADGKLVYFGGKTRQLKEGETVELTGVRRDRY